MLLKINGVARLTRDVELKYLPSGSALANIGLACSKKYKTQSGEQKEDVCFIDGAIFGRLAEVANQYLKKGSKIYIDGELKFEQWQDQNGNNRSKHTISINTFEMLDSKEQSEQNVQQKNSYEAGENLPPQQQQQYQAPRYSIPEIDIPDEEIPF